MHTANIEVNVVLVAAFDCHGKITLSPYEAEEVIGHEMTVDIGDHLNITKFALDSPSGSRRISNHPSRCSIDEPEDVPSPLDTTSGFCLAWPSRSTTLASNAIGRWAERSTVNLKTSKRL